MTDFSFSRQRTAIQALFQKEFNDTRGRQKSLSWKTDKTMANKMKRKTNIEYRTLH